MEGPEYEGIATPAGQQRSQQPGAAAAAAAGRQGPGAGSVPPRSSSQRGAPSAAAAGAAGQEGRRPSSSSAGPPSYGQLFGEAPAKAPAAAKAQPVEDDLLGMGSGGSTSSRVPSAAAAPAAAAAAAVDDDLLGFGGGSGSGSAAAASSSTAHIEDLFTVPSAKPRPAAAAAAPTPAAPALRASGSRGAGLDSMIDLGADLPAVDTSGFEDMYEVRRARVLAGCTFCGSYSLQIRWQPGVLVHLCRLARGSGSHFGRTGRNAALLSTTPFLSINLARRRSWRRAVATSPRSGVRCACAASRRSMHACSSRWVQDG